MASALRICRRCNVLVVQRGRAEFGQLRGPDVRGGHDAVVRGAGTGAGACRAVKRFVAKLKALLEVSRAVRVVVSREHSAVALEVGRLLVLYLPLRHWLCAPQQDNRLT